MKRTGLPLPIVVLVVLLGYSLHLSPLFAFNSTQWMAKRERMTADAKRLQAEFSNCVSRVTAPSEDLTIPLETNPDGSVRTSIFAKRAQFFFDSKLVWAEDLVMTKYDPDGTERLRLEAGKCVIDRVSRTGWIEGRAKVTQGKTVFEGDGVYFSSSNNFVTAYSDSEIRSADLRFGGVK